jgi:hypothetical protein
MLMHDAIELCKRRHNDHARDARKIETAKEVAREGMPRVAREAGGGAGAVADRGKETRNSPSSDPSPRAKTAASTRPAASPSPREATASASASAATPPIPRPNVRSSGDFGDDAAFAGRWNTPERTEATRNAMAATAALRTATKAAPAGDDGASSDGDALDGDDGDGASSDDASSDDFAFRPRSTGGDDEAAAGARGGSSETKSGALLEPPSPANAWFAASAQGYQPLASSPSGTVVGYPVRGFVEPAAASTSELMRELQNAEKRAAAAERRAEEAERRAITAVDVAKFAETQAAEALEAAAAAAGECDGVARRLAQTNAALAEQSAKAFLLEGRVRMLEETAAAAQANAAVERAEDYLYRSAAAAPGDEGGKNALRRSNIFGGSVQSSGAF